MTFFCGTQIIRMAQMFFIGAKNNYARGGGINFSEKFCGGVKHLNTSNSVATRQCSSELGIVLAAPSFCFGAYQ